MALVGEKPFTEGLLRFRNFSEFSVRVTEVGLTNNRIMWYITFEKLLRVNYGFITFNVSISVVKKSVAENIGSLTEVGM